MAPPKSDSVEGIVLKFVTEQNRPLNSQNVADALQKFNLKKTAVQKALDALSDSGQISFKEYGKQKIYMARQDQFEIPNNEELDHMKKENVKLQAELDEQKKAIADVESEIRALQSNLTLEQMRSRENSLKSEVKKMEEKLIKLRGGSTLVSAEERELVEEKFSEIVSQWRKRKRFFREIWDSITESNPKSPKEFKEDLGIEFDEDVGQDLQAFAELMERGKKRKR